MDVQVVQLDVVVDVSVEVVVDVLVDQLDVVVDVSVEVVVDVSVDQLDVVVDVSVEVVVDVWSTFVVDFPPLLLASPVVEFLPSTMWSNLWFKCLTDASRFCVLAAKASSLSWRPRWLEPAENLVVVDVSVEVVVDVWSTFVFWREFVFWKVDQCTKIGIINRKNKNDYNIKMD